MHNSNNERMFDYKNQYTSIAQNEEKKIKDTMKKTSFQFKQIQYSICVFTIKTELLARHKSKMKLLAKLSVTTLCIAATVTRVAVMPSII